MRRVLLLALTIAPVAIAPLYAQDAAAAAKSPYLSVLGTITKADMAGKSLSVKPDKADETSVKFDDKTAFLRVAAGETDMKKAVPATAEDAAVGDRVIARVLTADPAGKPARTIYVMKSADIAKRQEGTQEEWKNATSGLVSSVDAAGKQIRITAKLPGSPAPKEVTLDISGKVEYTHYNPDSGKYEPSTLDALKTGDQVRVLGEKNADSTQIKAGDIGFGSFRTVGVQIKTIDTAANQITGTETGSKRPVTVALRSDTSLKKFSDTAAMMVARQLNPSYQLAGGRGGRGAGGDGGGRAMGGPPAEGAAPPAGGDAAAGGRGSGGGRGFGAGRGRGGVDVGRIIEQQPAIQLSDLKPGDAIIVTGATAADPAKLTATALVAGVEPILRAAPTNGADPLAGSWNMGGGGEGGGAQ